MVFAVCGSLPIGGSYMVFHNQYSTPLQGGVRGGLETPPNFPLVRGEDFSRGLSEHGQGVHSFDSLSLGHHHERIDV